MSANKNNNNNQVWFKFNGFCDPICSWCGPSSPIINATAVTVITRARRTSHAVDTSQGYGICMETKYGQLTITN